MVKDKGLAWDVMRKSYKEFAKTDRLSHEDLDMLRDLYYEFVDMGIENSTDIYFDWATITGRWKVRQNLIWGKVKDTVYFSLTIPSVKSDKTLDLINLARDIGVPFNVSYGDPINIEEGDE